MPIHGFEAVSDPKAVVLVLGTMPGKASLAAAQYYGHPRNLFWPFVGEVLGFEPSVGYTERTSQLIKARVAIWDVLQLCTRKSSLDSDIIDPVPNDFVSFFRKHPRIARVCFNGAKAEALYRKRVIGKLDVARSLEYVGLPSTSPANASLTRASKLARWNAIKP